MDWLWFLGYNLDARIPNHSVLSKARKKWGAEVFQNFIERSVLQCVQAGLVDGSKIFVDWSLSDANASNNSVLDTKNLQDQLHRNYRKLETRLAEGNPSSCTSRHIEKKNSRYISTTDPDVAIVNRGKPKLMYPVHRAVDGKNEVITATAATAGDTNEAHLMLPLLKQREAITGSKVETVVADSKYGTIDNFLAWHDQGVKAHIPDLKGAALKRTKNRAIFTDDQFVMIRRPTPITVRPETYSSASHCRSSPSVRYPSSYHGVTSMTAFQTAQETYGSRERSTDCNDPSDESAQPPGICVVPPEIVLDQLILLRHIAL
jgi:hypothetical protein